MWTKKHRAKAVARTKELKRYPSDLTEDEWSVIAVAVPRNQYRASVEISDSNLYISLLVYPAPSFLVATALKVNIALPSSITTDITTIPLQRTR